MRRALHESLGARFAEFMGADRPESYGDFAAEYGALREAAGLVDLSLSTHIEVTGSDRTVFLSRLLSNDIEALETDCSLSALLLTPKGMLVAPLVVHHLGDRYLIVAPSAAHADAIGLLTMYVLSSDVQVADAAAARDQFGLFGPAAGAVLGKLGVDAGTGSDNRVVLAEIAGATVLVTRSHDLGTPGFDLHCPSQDAESVIRAVLDAGAAPAGWRAAEAVRITSGEARFGAELAAGMLAPEVPALAGRAISYTKGCYVGQETMSRLANYGRVNRELRGLLIGGKKTPEAGAVLSQNGKNVGVVTSACTPPDRDGTIGLGFVKRKHNEAGSKVEVEMPGGIALATVVPTDRLA